VGRSVLSGFKRAYGQIWKARKENFQKRKEWLLNFSTLRIGELFESPPTVPRLAQPSILRLSHDWLFRTYQLSSKDDQR
jgi:hypothetical protein